MNEKMNEFKLACSVQAFTPKRARPKEDDNFTEAKITNVQTRWSPFSIDELREIREGLASSDTEALVFRESIIERLEEELDKEIKNRKKSPN